MSGTTEIEQFLLDLGLEWIEIAEALSDGYEQKTISLVKNNPKITRIELLEELGIEKDY